MCMVHPIPREVCDQLVHTINAQIALSQGETFWAVVSSQFVLRKQETAVEPSLHSII